MKKFLVSKPKELVAKWPLREKFSLEGCVVSNCYIPLRD